MNVRWLLMCGACIAATAVGAEEVETPGVTPQWAVVKELNAETKVVQLLLTVTTPVYETYEHKVETPDGRVETRTVARVRQVPETRIRAIRVSDVTVTTVGKKELDDAAALKRLTANTPLLLIPPTQKLDPRYAAQLKDDTLILIAVDPAAEIPPGRLVPPVNPPPPPAPK